mmetsp:Transcript_19102/g.36533  ORF Transcript_19102/g.36533 Transcript_19102/m.36533 type:complete len:217 (-) Transcript_19102:488-1138(-)
MHLQGELPVFFLDSFGVVFGPNAHDSVGVIAGSVRGDDALRFTHALLLRGQTRLLHNLRRRRADEVIVFVVRVGVVAAQVGHSGCCGKHLGRGHGGPGHSSDGRLNVNCWAFHLLCWRVVCRGGLLGVRYSGIGRCRRGRFVPCMRRNRPAFVCHWARLSARWVRHHLPQKLIQGDLGQRGVSGLGQHGSQAAHERGGACEPHVHSAPKPQLQVQQ